MKTLLRHSGRQDDSSYLHKVVIGSKIEFPVSVFCQDNHADGLPDRDFIWISDYPTEALARQYDIVPQSINEYARHTRTRIEIPKSLLFSYCPDESAYEGFVGVIRKAFEADIIRVKKDEVQALAQMQFLTCFCDQYGNTIAIYLRHSNILWIRSFIRVPSSDRDHLKALEMLFSALRPATDQAPQNQCFPIIGADIEYSIIDSEGKFHEATEFVADSQEGAIGTDGNVGTLELRPRHGKDPIELVNNIESLLRDLNDGLPTGYDLMCGGGRQYSRSTGLHIHFSETSIDESRNDRAPQEVVEWLDQLIYQPIQTYCLSWQREDPHYGGFGDYRWRRNHGDFPHQGFEWRGLPTLTVDRKFTEAVFILAYLIMQAYEAGTTIEFDPSNFSMDWYSRLPSFDTYKSHIQYFHDCIQRRMDLNVPILSNWFRKNFEKDKECDVEIIFANDPSGYLNVAPFVMYNPQKAFDRVIIWSLPDHPKTISLSEPASALRRYVVKALGYGVAEISPSPQTTAKYIKGKRRVLFVGIDSQILHRLQGKSVGSRNRVKMFVQDLIKNM